MIIKLKVDELYTQWKDQKISNLLFYESTPKIEHNIAIKFDSYYSL